MTTRRAGPGSAIALALTVATAGVASSPANDAVLLTMGADADHVVAVDLDGNGTPDLATAHRAGGTISVRLNLGGGAFGPPALFPAGADPADLVAGDLDGDGDVDLLTVNTADDTVSVLRNAGDGTFAPPVAVPVGAGPVRVAAADIDGDDDLDLAVANFDGDSFLVLRNDGTGAFTPTGAYANIDGPRDLAFGDLDGDGDADLLVVGEEDRTIRRYDNGGFGFFTTSQFILADDAPSFVAIGDLDGDGDDDAAVLANVGDVGFLTVLTNDRGTLHDDTAIEVIAYFGGSLVLEDFDGDGRPEVALTCQWPGVAVLHNDGHGNLEFQRCFNVAGAARDLAAADLDADGRPDLVVAANPPGFMNDTNVSVLRNRGDGTFSKSPRFWVAGQNFRAADLDGDGDTDVLHLLFTASPPFMGILENDGSGGFRRGPDTSLPHGSSLIEVLDLDGDGDGDAMYGVEGAPDTLNFYRNDGNGAFAPAGSFVYGPNVHRLRFADLDDDGDADRAVTQADAPTVEIFLQDGTGSGTFTARGTHPTGIPSAEVLTGDFDGDDLVDLVFFTPSSAPTPSIALALGDGAGGLGAPAVAALPGDSSFTVQAGDLDGDGDDDLVVAQGGSLLVYLSPGDGTIPPPLPPVFAGGSLLAVRDFDGDGDADVAVRIGAGNFLFGISIHWSDGTGGLSPPQFAFGFGDWPSRIEAHDLNGDGAVDFAYNVLFDFTLFVEERLCPDSCPWDLDGDGGVGLADMNLVLAAWGPCPCDDLACPLDCPPDFDGSFTVGFADLMALLAAWGPCPASP